MKQSNKWSKRARVYAGITLLALGTGCAAELDAEKLGQTSQELSVSGFNGWNQIPNGTFTSGPAVTTRSSNVDVVARGGDNAIWYNNWVSAVGWTGWTSLGSTFTSKPSITFASGNANVALAVAGRRSDNKIYVKVATPGGTGHTTWQSWNSIAGATFDTAPAIVYLSPNLYVFARKSDQIVYYSKNNISSSYSSANWTSWSAVPNGTVTSEPAAVVTGGQIVLVARGGDTAYWLTRGNGTTWTGGWNQISGGSFSTGPAIVARNSSEVDVFGKGDDNAIWVATANVSNASTTGFVQIPNGTFTSEPAAVARNANRIDLVARGGDNAVWWNTWD